MNSAYTFCYCLKLNSCGTVHICRGLTLILIYREFSDMMLFTAFLLTTSVLFPRFCWMQRFCVCTYACEYGLFLKKKNNSVPLCLKAKKTNKHFSLWKFTLIYLKTPHTCKWNWSSACPVKFTAFASGSLKSKLGSGLHSGKQYRRICSLQGGFLLLRSQSAFFLLIWNFQFLTLISSQFPTVILMIYAGPLFGWSPVRYHD